MGEKSRLEKSSFGKNVTPLALTLPLRGLLKHAMPRYYLDRTL